MLTVLTLLMMLFHMTHGYTRSSTFFSVVYKRRVWDHKAADTYSFEQDTRVNHQDCAVSCIHDSECFGCSFKTDGTCYRLKDAGIGSINGSDLLNQIQIEYKAPHIIETKNLPLVLSLDGTETGVTATPSLVVSAGQFGRAIHLPAADDYATIDMSLVNKCPIYGLEPDCQDSEGATLSMWLKFQNTTEQQTILHNQFISLVVNNHFNSDGSINPQGSKIWIKITVWKDGTKKRTIQGRSYGMVTFDEWFHFVYVLNGVKGKYVHQYWNGVMAGENLPTAAAYAQVKDVPRPDPEPLRIGANQADNTLANANMQIEQMKGWPLILTPTEIRLLYNSYL